VRVTLIGATGRMGGALLRAAPEFPRLRITGAVASAGSAGLGKDAGELAGVGPLGLPVGGDLARALADADVALDFSSAAVARAHLAACRAAARPLLLGTTGLGPELEPELASAAREIPLLIAANASLGAAVLTALVRLAARALPDFDLDILDVHHRSKRDAPSGTALALAAAAREARAGGTPRRRASDGPAAPGAGPAASASGSRPQGEIGFAAVRSGDAVGEHTVLLAGPGEQLALTHRALDRGIFARGALAAALWLQSRPPGRYAMSDVLGVKTST
jgi:4-hydroxy-tetrahydrodipicolinate reductase